MKIGIILIANGFAGAERVVYNLVKSLSQNKKIKLHLLVNKEVIQNYKDLDNITLHNIGKCTGKNFILNRFKIMAPKKRLKEIITKEKFDIIQTNMFISPEFYNVIFKNKAPHVLTFHGSEIKEFISNKNLLYLIVFRPVFEKVMLKSNLLTSVSEGLIENISQKYKQKTVVIPNGVDSQTFKSLKSIKQKENVILFTGRFIELKGIKEILSVAKQLPQYEFWFAGKGKLEEEIIKLPNCKNLGFKSTEELVNLYNKATICIFPSHREGSPLCGLEAMSCGRAVIATPLGFSEYIDDKKNGIIIPTKDEGVLKNAIVDLMTNEKKRKMLEKNARKKALKYSWTKIVKQYLKVFREVVKENKR